jgi:mono/diheme cytochrome c family protein
MEGFMKRATVRLLFCSAFALASLSGLAAADTDAQLQIKAGHEIAERFCARCHAIGPEGSSPHKSAPPFRAIVAKGNVQNLEEALGEGIIVGHPDMPQFQFKPQDVGALVAYLKSLSGKG